LGRISSINSSTHGESGYLNQNLSEPHSQRLRESVHGFSAAGVEK